MTPPPVSVVQSFLESLGWTLLHFLWQGAVVAIALSFVLWILRRASPNARYLAACVALATLVALPVATAIRLGNLPAGTFRGAPPTPATSLTSAGLDTPRPPGLSSRNPFRPLAERRDSPVVANAATSVGFLFQAALPWVVLAWGLGVALLSGRLLASWYWLRRSLARYTRPLPDEWVFKFNQLRELLRIRRPVRLLESIRLTVPSALGGLRPVVLLPASAITGLTPAQLEAILLHELAHIRRHDAVVNFFQCAIETLFFYHPAVWWVSRRIRVERENCCDDLAISVNHDPVGYARALSGLAELCVEQPTPALAATGSPLLDRVRRLLVPGAVQPLGSLAWFAGILSAASVAILILTLASSAPAESKSSGVEPVADDTLPVESPITSDKALSLPDSDDVRDMPAELRLVAGDPMKRYALIGPGLKQGPPPGGFRLLVVLPGGDGSIDFHPFVKRIAKSALDDRYLVAQLIAPKWSDDQFDSIVWPTRTQPWTGMQFSTEGFIEAVIDDVKKRTAIDPKHIYALGWSSSGPAVYAESLAQQKSVAGSFIAMSVFKPDVLPPLANASGHAYFLLYSPDDYIPAAMPEAAHDLLIRNGAQVRTKTYEGGHGWHGDVYGNIASGIRWLETAQEKPTDSAETSAPAAGAP